MGPTHLGFLAFYFFVFFPFEYKYPFKGLERGVFFFHLLPLSAFSLLEFEGFRALFSLIPWICLYLVVFSSDLEVEAWILAILRGGNLLDSH